MTYSKAKLIYEIFSTLTFFSFVAFLLIAFLLGGDACSGKVVSGHYLVANHGRYSEVSRAMFYFSGVSGFFVLLFFSISGAAQLWMLRHREKAGG